MRLVLNDLPGSQVARALKFRQYGLIALPAIYSMLGADGSSAELSPEARTEEIFAKMDENKDGVLTRDEFMNGCLSDQYLLSMLLADEPAE
ncbi:unnamed protein product [Schistocephalus solidus]|uniref:EF-hand domain-containing protein n=1 Tax=Schistocephalus solidus TaxID=70667 RepID=A0A183T8B7_SCHSO|nr:unnamed protein product [Schistocephalus solidus]